MKTWTKHENVFKRNNGRRTFLCWSLLLALFLFGCQSTTGKTEDSAVVSSAETTQVQSESADASQADASAADPTSTKSTDSTEADATTSEATASQDGQETSSVSVETTSSSAATASQNAEGSTVASATSTPATSASNSSETAPVENTPLAVYYVKDNGTDMVLVREIHETSKTTGVAHAALTELISGTIQTEGAKYPLPANTKILGITIQNGLCVVDFSKEVLQHNVGAGGEVASIQAIVNTLTEFPTIDTVEFWVEGSKERANNWWGHVGLSDITLQRDLSNVCEPAIWVDKPVPNSAVGLALRVTGSIMTFESTAGYRLIDANGKVIDSGHFTGKDHQGMRSFFDITLRYAKPQTHTGAIEIFGFSGKDGSETDLVSVPVVFK